MKIAVATKNDGQTVCGRAGEGFALPSLAARSTGDMKWKKFTDRHHCSRESIYVCPAASCGPCADHGKCFAPED